VRLNTDSQRGVGLFPLEQFDVVSQKIPPNWVVSWNALGVFELTTMSWTDPRYWERYFDGDPDAERTFQREMIEIVAADP